MFLKTNLGYLSQIAQKNMQLLIQIDTCITTEIFPFHAFLIAHIISTV